MRTLLVAVLTTAVVLQFSSCSHCGSSGVQDALSAADSLMMTDPRAALDTLLTIDSSSVERLGRSDMAFYTLLKTEAEYKCWLPVAEDTTVFKATAYYGRRGPDDRLVRALIMQGAVQYERGDAEAAMESYKSAEPVAERVGDMEQLGLLHTRIGDLYRFSFVNDEASIERYMKALKCFEQAGLEERIMFTHLTMASVIMPGSPDSALVHTAIAQSMARESGNRLCGIDTWLQYMHNAIKKGQYKDVISMSRQAFSEYGAEPEADNEADIYSLIYAYLSESYARTGMTDSAEIVLTKVTADNAVDSLSKLSTEAVLAEKKGDWKEALRLVKGADSILNSLLSSNYEKSLLEIERKYDNAIIKEELSKQEWINRTVILSFLSILALVTVFVLFLLHRLERQKSEMLKLVAASDELRAELNSKQRKLDGLHSDLNVSENARIQEELELRVLRERLESQSSAQKDLMSLNGDLLAVTKEISDLYYMYGSEPSSSSGWLESRIRHVLSERLPKMSTFARIDSMLESVYPGFMHRLCNEYPWLDKEQKNLISLMCCGFTNNAIAVIMNMDMRRLNERKTRLARKMGVSIRLSTYLRKRLASCQAGSGEVVPANR